MIISALEEYESKISLYILVSTGMNSFGFTNEFIIQNNKSKVIINEYRAKQQNLVLSRFLLDMAV